VFQQIDFWQVFFFTFQRPKEESLTSGRSGFVDFFNDQIRSKLRLIPDKAGPLIFLRSFGTVPFWRETVPFPVAHPCLIYAELMYSPDARAHEAAEELKREFLSM
jgi:hypothetical protein